MLIQPHNFSQKSARVKQLDVLRAIAIFLVLGRHKYVSDLWMQVGWMGVDLFFVLSGFLISGLLFGEYKKYNQIDIKRFFIRRGFKIYPAFYVFLIVTILYNALMGHPLRAGQVLAEVFFVQNYIEPVWNHTWSLAVEEHFYILLPVLLIVLYRLRQSNSDPFKPLVMIFLAVAGFCLGFRLLTSLVLSYNHQTHVFPTHLRIDSLLFGVVLSYFSHFHQAVFDKFVRRHFRNIFLLSTAAITFTSLLFEVEEFFTHSVGFTLLYLGFGGLLVVCLHGDTKPESPTASDKGENEIKNREIRAFLGDLISPVTDVLAFIGFHSYSIYLWHMAVAKWGSEIFSKFYPYKVHFLVEFFIYAVCSVGVGIFMAKLVETPTLKLRDKLFPSRIIKRV